MTWPKWGIVLDGVAGGGNAVGAPHQRERVFIMAHSQRFKCYERLKNDIQRGRENQAQQIRLGSSSEFCLMWPTPTASDVFTGDLKSSQQKLGSMHSVTLPQAIQMWPTPCASKISGTTRSDFSISLPEAVKLWPTPGADDFKSANRSIIQSIERHKEKGVNKQIMLRDIPVFEKTQGHLNPDWVECLMNFPIGWTNPDCENPLPWPGWPAYRNQEQFDYEPPRVVIGMKHRPKRLKALGNAELQEGYQYENHIHNQPQGRARKNNDNYQHGPCT